jgi:hypothetical protein
MSDLKPGWLDKQIHDADICEAVRVFSKLVLWERFKQDRKFGKQNHPDGTPLEGYIINADFYRDRCNKAAAAGRLSWDVIFLEEVYEALSESDPEKLKAELIQVAAVAAAWIEAIDRRPNNAT